MPTITIRPAAPADDDAIWSILEPIVREGESYALPTDLGRADTLAFWCADGHEVFVAELDGVVKATAFLRANQRGGGAHIANAGYAVAGDAIGLGLAGKLCEATMAYARKRGFAALQFNFVVSTNERAVQLWQRLGFRTVGVLPAAFVRPNGAHVDVLVMFQEL